MSSDSPVIFKRSKTKTTARSRQLSPETNAENSGPEVSENSPSTLATKLKNKIKKAKPKSRLSFGGDEEVSHLLLLILLSHESYDRKIPKMFSRLKSRN